jgi:Protein of unknown function (DUF2510)
MDMPPAGWYPDPYGVPDLLRWWDGSTWTQHTHEGGAPQAPGAAGTSLDMTRVGEASGGAGGGGAAGGQGAGTAIQRMTPPPGAVQPAAAARGPQDATVVQPTAVQHPSWPDAGPSGGHGAPPRQDGDGTRVLMVNESAWTSPGQPGGYGGRPGGDQDQRRRRMMLGGLLAGGTAVALALIALVVNSLTSSAPPATTTAQNTTPPTSAPVTPAPTPTPASPAASPAPSISTVPGGVSDSISGLTYPLLAAPWANGCPASLSNQQTATWTAGESALAGQVSSNGQQVNWYAEACSGPLPQQYGYNGVADLEPAAMNLLNAIDGPYYGALNHSRTQLASTPVSVSGHPGWEIKYLMTYPDAASQGLAWNSEEGAVVLADQGNGLPPSVFLVSVPSNLSVATVDALVGSLTLTVAQQPGNQPSTTPPSTGNGGGGDNGGGGGNHP